MASGHPQGLAAKTPARADGLISDSTTPGRSKPALRPLPYGKMGNMISEVGASGSVEDFFGQDARLVARQLLGATLWRQREEGEAVGWPITETEAYVGPEDAASHAYRGRRTRRTEVMFGPPGCCYLYLCYGLHWMLNFVTGPVGFPAAVLIRGVGVVRGPGRVTRHLGLDGARNGLPLSPETGLWVTLAETPVPEAEITTGPRVGIDYASEPWLSQPWRWQYTPPAR